MNTQIKVTGMHCDNCVGSVSAALQKVPGVRRVSVDLDSGLADIEGDANRKQLEAAVIAAGFGVGELAMAGVRQRAAPPGEATRADLPASQVAPAASTDDAGQLLAVQGMSCASCVAKVEQALKNVAGVHDAQVNFADASAWVSGSVSTEQLIEAVRRAGYRASAVESAPPLEPAASRFVPALIALSAGALLMVWMPAGEAALWSAPGVLLLMAYCGGHFFANAWRALRHGSATMDSLIALGTGAAWLLSTVVAALPELFEATHTYFDAALMILGFVNLGQGLELRARARTSRALRELLALEPEQAIRVDAAGNDAPVAVAQLRVGEQVRVRAGERFAIDGVIVEGVTSVDESMLTGEPMPVARGIGQAVAAGTVNGLGSVLVRATAVGSATALARIVALVRRAQNAKPALGRLADRVAAVFVPAVLFVALLTAAVWWWLGPDPKLHYVFLTAMTVLIIACPCALGLATPLSVMVAVGRAAKMGLLIREGQALERAGAATLVVLDKTGTLTGGKPQLRRAVMVQGFDEHQGLAIAAALERGSVHPVAEALRQADRTSKSLKVSHFREHPGEGVTGVIGAARYALGNERMMKRARVQVPEQGSVATLAKEGATAVHLARDNHWLGVFWVGDALREDSAAAVQRLRDCGLRVLLLSGDAPDVVTTVAASAHIDDAVGGLTPEAKARYIHELRDQGAVMIMVGDGINDAPALALADVGVAMGEGAAAAIETADVTLLRPSLHGVADLVMLSRATTRNIKQNLLGAFFYNLLAIPVAAGVLYPLLGLLMNPMLGSAAMALSSVTVVTNAQRLRRLKLN